MVWEASPRKFRNLGMNLVHSGVFRRIFRRNGDLVRSKNTILVSVIVQKLTLPSVIVPSSSVARFCSTVCYCASK